jgi:hypothetical protein
MSNFSSCVLLIGLFNSAISVTPASAQDYEPGPANAFAEACRSEAATPDAFSVGACLALTRENATNELSTFCAWAKQEGLLGAASLRNVAECIAYLKAVEEES